MTNAPVLLPDPSVMHAPAVRIYLLGPMRIERDTVPIHLPRRKVESLLAYLLLHPQQQTRERLATLFWGDSSDAQARHSLRTALATLRQHLGPDLLDTDRDHVKLNAGFPLWVDLYQLLGLEETYDQVTSDFLHTQLSLWQGELLAGYYDEWITAAREHYQARLLQLFLHVTQTLRARSEYTQAIAIAQRVLAFDAANEHAHQHIMFCYVAAGDRPAALRQYELCVRALQDELDVPPLTETTALYQWIKQVDGPEPASAGRITNIPIPLTSFVGRTRETAEVKRLLAPSLPPDSGHNQDRRSSVRLLTLTGAGGTGKTRLAIQVATDLIDSYAHGVWWVELAALGDGGTVARAVAKSLGVKEAVDQTVSQAVATYIEDKRLLLVLDNCEHLVGACARMAADLLGQCPQLQIFATSREPLNIAGEVLWQVPPFAAPDPGKLTLVELLLQFEGLKLFVERAVAVQPNFTLTPANAQAVAEICQQLDGIPLAIELAAARVKVLSVEQIAAYVTGAIGARFALLTQGSRTALPRHQTLRATIDWSYDLLDDAERSLFRQIAVFRGGFTLEALEQLVSSRSNSPLLSISKTLDLLTQLIDKSLVIVEQVGGHNRYRMLETLREYALEQFVTADEMKRLQQVHAEVFLRLADQAEPELLRAQQQSWLQFLEYEYANLCAALDYSLADAEGEKALRLATALHRFWDYRGYVSEGRGYLAHALASCRDARDEIRAKALNAAGWLAYRQGDLAQARPMHEEALLLFQHVEDEIGVADSIQYLALIDMDQGDHATAQKRLDQTLAIYRELQYEAGIARSLSRLGYLAWEQDRFADACTYHRESLRINQRLGSPLNIAFESLAVGDAERLLDNFDAARTYYDECLQIAQEIGHKGLVGAVLKSQGLLAIKQKNYDQARRYGLDALQIFSELGDKVHIGFALSSLGHIARKCDQQEQALSYYCQSLQHMHEVGYKWPTFYALEDIASLLTEAGKYPEWAIRLLGAANVLRQEIGLARTPNQQTTRDHIVTSLRQQLGDDYFDAVWQAGESTPLAQIVAEATGLSLT